MTKNRKTTTCEQLELVTVGCWPIMPKTNLPRPDVRGSHTTLENENFSEWNVVGDSQEPIRGRLFMEVLWHPFGTIFLAWKMNLWEVFTESVDDTTTGVGNNKKSQIKNWREVSKSIAVERWKTGESGRLSFHSRRMENGEFFFTSIQRRRMNLREWISPSARDYQSCLATCPFSENRSGLGSITIFVNWRLSLVSN